MSKILVTGVLGCIGCWTAHYLLKDGHTVIGSDVSDQTHRLEMLGIKDLFLIEHVDIRDGEALEALIQRERPQAVIHLAALQVPICKTNPLRCSEVNVGGMMKLLELARVYGFSLVYASSAAVYGSELGRTLTEEEGIAPQTLYGVFKRTNEEMAKIYGQDYHITSAGFRPYVVYGPGRDIGMTSDITVALFHAARGEAFQINFGNQIALQYTADVARIFTRAAVHPKPGAHVYNLRGTVTAVSEVVGCIENLTNTNGLVTWIDTPIPIAADLSDQFLQQDYGPFKYVDLKQGLEQTLAVWNKSNYV